MFRSLQASPALLIQASMIPDETQDHESWSNGGWDSSVPHSLWTPHLLPALAQVTEGRQ